MGCTPSKYSVCIFEDCSYKKGTTFALGDYKNADIIPHIANVMSIRIGPMTTIMLYSEDNFRGDVLTLTNPAEVTGMDIECLNKYDFGTYTYDTNDVPKDGCKCNTWENKVKSMKIQEYVYIPPTSEVESGINYNNSNMPYVIAIIFLVILLILFGIITYYVMRSKSGKK